MAAEIVNLCPDHRPDHRRFCLFVAVLVVIFVDKDPF